MELAEGGIMSIMLAVVGCVAASGADPADYGIVLPDIDLASDGYELQRAEIAFWGNEVELFSTQQGLSTHTYNPNGHDRSLFQVRLSKISGADPDSGRSLGEWWDLSLENMFWHFSQSTTGSLGFTGTLEIRLKATGEILASSGVSISLQRLSYGLVLNFPTSVSTSGTSDRYVQLAFQGGSGDNIALTRTEGIVGDYNWNPNGHSRGLFEVRAVHVSGTAPTSGSALGTWYSADTNRSWRWDRSAAGTTTGQIRLEIRDKSTLEVLVTRDLSVSLTKQATYSDYTVTVGHRALIGDKVRDDIYGYEHDVADGITTGSISSTSYRGSTIIAICYSSLLAAVQFRLTGNHESNPPFSSVVINGTTFTLFSGHGGAVYNPGTNQTHFLLGPSATNPFGTTTGVQRSVRIHY